VHDGPLLAMIERLNLRCRMLLVDVVIIDAVRVTLLVGSLLFMITPVLTVMQLLLLCC
jgi:hypothetical protein